MTQIDVAQMQRYPSEIGSAFAAKFELFGVAYALWVAEG